MEGAAWGFEDHLRDKGRPESEIDELLAIGVCGVMMNTLTDTCDVSWENRFDPRV